MSSWCYLSNEVGKAFCSICKETFRCDNQGLPQLLQHAKGQNHKTLANEILSGSQMVFAPTQLTEPGEDAVDQFFQDMMELEEDLLPYMDLTQEEKDRHHRATVCYICHKPFTQQDWKVRDHDHATQEYQGPAHNTCDLQKRRRTVIPVIVNNLRGFDSHLLMQQLHTVEARK